MREIRWIAGAALVAIATAGCSSGAAPGWTFPPTAAARRRGVGRPGRRRDHHRRGRGHADDHGLRPRLQARVADRARGGPYEVKLDNTGSTAHDVTFPDGTKIAADAGATGTGEVDVPAGGLSFLCSIPGHAAAGMQGAITVAGGTAGSTSGDMPGMAHEMRARSRREPPASAPVADPNAPAYALRDPPAPTVLAGPGPRHRSPDHRDGRHGRRWLRRARLDLRRHGPRARPSACISVTRSTST